MKRLLTLFCTIAALAGPLGLAGEAAARDQGGGRGNSRSAEAPARGRGDAQPAWRGREERAAPRFDPRPFRGEPRAAPAEPRAYRGESPEPYGPPPAYYAPTPRRGGYMAPQAGGAVEDYGRYRLRPPPRGYSWVRTGNGYAMVREDTGQVFDIVPY